MNIHEAYTSEPSAAIVGTQSEEMQKTLEMTDDSVYEFQV